MGLAGDTFEVQRRTVCVQGLGFVGAAMSVAIASAKDHENKPLYNVIGIDVPGEAGYRKANSINEGIFPYENSDKKLELKLQEAIQNGNLKATTDSGNLAYAEIVVVDINLDVKYTGDDSPYLDLDLFKNAMRTIGKHIKETTLVLVETTVPPGTCQKVVAPIIKEEFEKRGLKGTPHIAHSYERVMPGENYLDSIISYWRVYSGIDEVSADMCEAFLKSVIRTDQYPLTRLMNTTSTETAKVLENSYRATTIAFMEEWGRFAENVGIDLFEIVDAIRMRPTHSNMRQPGFGVGGYCLTKDPYFAMLASKDLFGRDDLEFPFSTMAVRYNKIMPLVSVSYLEKFLDGLEDKKILLLGVSYRQDVGDTRYSPSEIFAREILKKGARLTCEDPLVKYWPEMQESVRNDIPEFGDYDAVVFAVQHKQYADIDFSEIQPQNSLLIFDANKVLNNQQIEDIKRNKSFIYKSIGRNMG